MLSCETKITYVPVFCHKDYYCKGYINNAVKRKEILGCAKLFYNYLEKQKSRAK